MITIDLSEDARASGRLAGEELRAAVDALRSDGFVVLNDVVDPIHLDILHERMIDDLDALQARPDAPYNWNAGNLQQDPPPFPPYLFADILLNAFVISVTSAVLGPRIKNVMYGGNTALPSDQRQPVHADVGHLWPLDMLECPHPAAQLVVNVLTVELCPKTGPPRSGRAPTASSASGWVTTSRSHRRHSRPGARSARRSSRRSGGAACSSVTSGLACRNAESHLGAAADDRDDPHQPVAGDRHAAGVPGRDRVVLRRPDSHHGGPGSPANRLIILRLRRDSKYEPDPA